VFNAVLADEEEMATVAKVNTMLSCDLFRGYNPASLSKGSLYFKLLKLDKDHIVLRAHSVPTHLHIVVEGEITVVMDAAAAETQELHRRRKLLAAARRNPHAVTQVMLQNAMQKLSSHTLRQHEDTLLSSRQFSALNGLMRPTASLRPRSAPHRGTRGAGSRSSSTGRVQFSGAAGRLNRSRGSSRGAGGY
jgi:hypothetical protein